MYINSQKVTIMTISFVMSVHLSTCKISAHSGFFLFEYFLKICYENLSFIKI